LRERLIDEGYKEYKCERCLLSEWLNGKIPLHLHHKDGNSENHKLENLEILCPNCHCLTDTYGSKNISDKTKEKKE
jgi:5-methylcytosine-specific restriction endonuclease McrA